MLLGARQCVGLGDIDANKTMVPALTDFATHLHQI